ncbi:uncharacterized protein CTHT_0016190 [Thermochaetoides thermophila DSM 1495]|uniref:Letm1 RBD domain-containing protein n=1 Tax=Chaetomium thermophilum (strain DSM 1495 / CBS 144.50 / IMI 039719) TaxID=759272 RepID=G0S270_CHATD|nr:hypothetical protein CTHT_0016190 [Thermochaetoides thermophila DSM 1495]EGS22103.1 hypothetical protein CTHT_0016190 [Thermochaetoides thermophila DSM 1495]
MPALRTDACSPKLHETQSYTLSPEAANPPPTTRPAPLDIPPPPHPKPDPFTIENLRYRFAIGRAYLQFYKAGLKNIWLNTRLLYSSSATSDPELSKLRPYPSTRADLLLRQRWRHDVRRLPLFALLLLIFEEFTPLIVLLLPKSVPLTCRIPKQVQSLLRKAESSRREARALPSVQSYLSSHNSTSKSLPVDALATILSVRSSWTLPLRFLLASKVQRRLKFLSLDDALLIQAGGQGALVGEEVVLACVDRGIEVVGRDVDSELRVALGRWLARVAEAERKGGQESGERERVRMLLEGVGGL